MSTLAKKFKIEKKTLLGQILDLMTPTIEKRIEAIRNAHVKEGKNYSKFSEECDRIYLIHDLCKSVGTYTLPSDKLIELTSYISPKGNFEISAKLKRDGQDFYLSTEVILAGGYNIQRLHVRYITHTNLPKAKTIDALELIKAEVKKMRKIERLNEDVLRFENYIKQANEKLAKWGTYTDEQIYLEEGNSWVSKEWKKESLEQIFPSWEEIVRRGADVNFNSEEAYNLSVQNRKDFYKKNHKEKYFTNPTNRIKRMKLEIQKIKAKIKEEKAKK